MSVTSGTAGSGTLDATAGEAAGITADGAAGITADGVMEAGTTDIIPHGMAAIHIRSTCLSTMAATEMMQERATRLVLCREYIRRSSAARCAITFKN
jgi:hypothetical protein